MILLLNKRSTHLLLESVLSRNKARLFIKYYSSLSKELLNINNFEQKSISIPKINHQRNQNRISSVHSTINVWLSTVLGKDANLWLSYLTRLMYKLEILQSRDPQKYIKISKMYSTWLRNNCLIDPNFQGCLSDDQWNRVSNYPVLLGELKYQCNLTDFKSINRMVFIALLSVFETYHCILAPVKPNIATILAPYSGIEEPIQREEIESALSNLNIDIEKFRNDLQIENSSDEWHVSSASGPNGQSLWMAHLDAKAVWTDKELKSHLETFCILNNRQYLMEKLEDTIRLPNFFKVSQTEPQHSKLHIIHEKGNKARIIAILDYWTQEVLNPLHNSLANILKGLMNDATFNQDKGCDMVKSFTNNKNISLYSLDLSAATDRLPRSLQETIISLLTGSDLYGKAWSKLIAERTFNFFGNGSYGIRYEVGQPMGAKSSFPMLGLTHHIIVNIAAQRSGKPHFNEYVILGDDIVIGDTDVAISYQLIMKNLGLEIVENKSIVTLDKDNNKVAEFCKRLFVNGKSWTPLPTKLIATVAERQELAYQLQEELGKRELYDTKVQLDYIMAGILKEKPYIDLAVLNGLPGWMTGMKYSFPNPAMKDLDYREWEKTVGLSEQTLQTYFTYSVVVEQLKRLNTILQNTESTYKTIVKAADVSRTIGIGKPEEGYLPVEDFSSDIAEEWDIVETFHPATKAVFDEVNRINLIIMQMANADIDMLQALRSGLIDSLKISSYETSPDTRAINQRVTRRLIDQTINNLKKGVKTSSKSLTFSIKLARLNMIWNVKAAFDSPCIISRSTTRIASFGIEAKQRMESYSSPKKMENFKPFTLF